jgi:hypothetical protein
MKPLLFCAPHCFCWFCHCAASSPAAAPRHETQQQLLNRGTERTVTLKVHCRYVDNLNSGVEENYNHTTHLFGKVYDICAEKWRDLLNSKHVTGGLSLKSDALYGPYIQGLSKHKLVTLQDCESFLASVISASQSFGSAFHVIVTFDIVRVPLANPSAMRYACM